MKQSSVSKWVEVFYEYTYEGVAVTVCCERAGITLEGFQTWKHEGESIESKLITQLEKEVIGGPIDLDKVRFSHASNRDLANLIVIEAATYLPFDLTCSESTESGITQTKAREIAYERLIDAIWDHRLKQITLHVNK